MEGTHMEKKVWYLGTWRDNVIGDNIIKSVALHVNSNRGYKVKLDFSHDGMRVIKSNVIQGKVMTDYISITNVHFVTVNQYSPTCLLIIANDTKKKYKLLAFKCANALDAGLFVGCFRDLRKRVKVGEGYHVESKNHDGINWTLRSKNAANDKRQLSKLVDVSGGTAVVQQNGWVNGGDVDHSNKQQNRDKTVEKTVVASVEITQHASQSQPRISPREKVIREDKYMEGKVQHNIGVQAAGYPVDGMQDNMSVSSDSSALRDELDYLSHELREIKFMLEKSTGISASEYQQDKRNIDTNRKTEVVVENKYVIKNNEPPSSPTDSDVLHALDPIDAVVLDEEEDSPRENGEVIMRSVRGRSPETMGEAVHASVPDFRGSVSKTGPKDIYVKRQDKPKDTSGPEILRAKTTGYNSWKNDVVLRGHVSGRHTRPRTGYGSTSSYYSSTNGSIHGSLRSSHGAPGHVQFAQPGTTGGSVKLKPVRFSTTVQKPIEKVYQRPHSVHGSVRGSITYRPRSVQGQPIHTLSIYQPVKGTDINQNHINGHVEVKGQNGPESPTSTNSADIHALY